jgi:hypothetical protein
MAEQLKVHLEIYNIATAQRLLRSQLLRAALFQVELLNYTE